MLEKTIAVAFPEGMHARPAGEFVKTASKFAAHIQVGKNGQFVDGKSILGVMSLAIGKGEEMVIRADGTDEEQALAALVEVMQGG